MKAQRIIYKHIHKESETLIRHSGGLIIVS